MDATAAHAFIDEAVVADVAVRRMWHTGLAVSRGTDTGRAHGSDTLVVHVAGAGTVQINSQPAQQLAPNDVLLVPHVSAVSYRSAEPVARIEIDHGSGHPEAAFFHTHRDLVSVVMITSAVNALFAAHDLRGGGGGG
ncbi:hypothetical protein, partial [Microbacterium sp. T32]|uniref:hypothetical protein n=1 Tax=Microbacterium sp. T32 TaxID=1776083 RepID=UPI0012E80287